MTDAAIVTRPPLKLATKLFYGVGAVANAVKLRGLSMFLLIFYNQVVGLPPHMVTTGIFIALVFDAFVDPLIGQTSDNFNSRWGRRHPFMYAAAIPVSLAFFLLWNPPIGWSDQATFGYMLACLLTIRFFDTFFELPSTALAPELAKDYDERTALFAIRAFFQVVGGLGMTLAVYQIFMRQHKDAAGVLQGGITERAGYLPYSICAAILIFSVILLSTGGTHNQIPYLAKPPVRKITFTGMVREIAHTLNNRSFLVATLAGMFIATATAAKNGLELYFALYYWGLNQNHLSILTITGVAASMCGIAMAPHVARLWGKRKGGIIMFSIALAVGLSPYIASLLGVMPARGSTPLFLILAVEQFINTAFAIATGVILASMIADVVEDAQVRTGRRSEGLLFSADNLFKKIVSGAGALIAGAVLTVVQFPENARKTGVDDDVLRNLVLIYLPLAAALYGAAILCIFFFKLDRASHEENLRKIAEAALAEEAVPAAGTT